MAYETLYFSGAERAEKVEVFLKRGYKEANLTKKVTLFKGDNLPTIYTLTDNNSKYVMRNVIAFSPETPLELLSFRTIEDGRIFLHSNMTEFPTSRASTQKESYRVLFRTKKELSSILDELISVYRARNRHIPAKQKSNNASQPTRLIKDGNKRVPAEHKKNNTSHLTNACNEYVPAKLENDNVPQTNICYEHVPAKRVTLRKPKGSMSLINSAADTTKSLQKGLKANGAESALISEEK